MVSKITRAAGVIALVAGLGMTGTAFAAGSASHARGGGDQVTPGSTYSGPFCQDTKEGLKKVDSSPF